MSSDDQRKLYGYQERGLKTCGASTGRDLMSETLRQIAARVGELAHPFTKPPHYYSIYERYLHLRRTQRGLKLMSFGVYTGESIKMFSEYFDDVSILGVDHENRGVDLDAYPNASFRIADQTNRPALQAMAAEFAPEGLDFIIDDASHIGWFSRETFHALIASLKPRGLYFIEDWGTAYVEDWVDGGAKQPLGFPDWTHENFPRRIESHSFGMAGFVKELIDEVHADAVKPSVHAPPQSMGAIDFVHCYPGMVVVRKNAPIDLQDNQFHF